MRQILPEPNGMLHSPGKIAKSIDVCMSLGHTAGRAANCVTLLVIYFLSSPKTDVPTEEVLFLSVVQ